MSQPERADELLAALRDALREVVEAPAVAEAPPPSEDGEEPLSPRAAAANALGALAVQARDAYWDADDAPGEAACALLGEISMYAVDPVLRETMLDLANRCLGVLAEAHAAGAWAPRALEQIQALFTAARPADDDATAIARALGMSEEEAAAFGLTGSIVTVGLDEDEVTSEEWAAADGGSAADVPAPVPVETLDVLFRRDAHELVSVTMPRALQRYWRNQSSSDELLAVRRAFHTLKGDAAVTAHNVEAPDEVEELRGLSRVAEAAEDIIDELLGDDHAVAGPAPALPPGAFGLLNETQAYLLARLDARAALPGESDLLARLEAMQSRARALAGVTEFLGSSAALGSSDAAEPNTPAAERPSDPSTRQPGAARLLATFLSEAAKLMPDLHRALARLSDEPGNENALVRARVKLHTLKGGATLAGPDAVEIERLAHSGEDVLELIEDYQLDGSLNTVPAEVLDCVLDVEDALQALLDKLRAQVDGAAAGASPSTLPALDSAALIARLASVKASVERGELAAQQPAGAVPAAENAAASTVENTAVSAAVPATASAIEPLQPFAGLVPLPALPRAVAAPAASTAAQPAPAGVETPASPPAAQEDSVQAAVRALEDQQVSRDALDVLLGAMAAQAVEARQANARLRDLATRVEQELAGLRQELVKTTRRTGDWDALEKEEYTSIDVLLMQLDEALADQRDAETRLRRDLAEARAQTEAQADALLRAQRAMLDISMVPLSSLESRLDHAVRTVARRLKKSVAFSLDGGDVTLDRGIAESLASPLMLLINNAVDHGMEETPAERTALGKAPEGRIVVRGRTDGDSVTVEIGDDGRGIDTARIAAVAVSKGLVEAHRAAAMTHEERLALIWEPGFSTARQVSAISGRGMGMKSVRDEIAALHGRIEVRSTAGQGTTFTITLPRSLAMMRVQVIREGEHQVAVPIVDLTSTHAVSYGSIVEVPGGRAVRVGARTLSVYPAHLSAGPSGGVSAQAHEREGILIEIAGRDGGMLVDDVLYSQYLPVRPAPSHLRRSCGLLGYALGTGGVIMPILDVETVLGAAAPAAPLLHLDGDRSARAPRQHTILVVDDSQTVRRALSQTFARAGFLVREAHNGREALTAIRREMPDLITLDMEMPGMDGLETLSALRLLPGGGDVPVFMITSRQQARHRAAAIAAGVTRYFTKPYDDDELIGAARLDLAARASSEAAS